MMRTFDVLSSEPLLKGKIFLEASAGTGKTFAIEHVILRSLLEGSISHVENILAVTFTNAATNELKCRIQSTLARALHQMQAHLEYQSPFTFPYLSQYDPIQSYLKLKGALTDINRMCVHTLHSFCHEILKQYFPDIHAPTQNLTTLPTRDIRRHIQQYLAQELWREVLFPQQLLFLTSYYHSDTPHTNHLISSLLDSYADNPPTKQKVYTKETMEDDWQNHWATLQDASLPRHLSDVPSHVFTEPKHASFAKTFLNKETIEFILKSHLRQHLETTHSLWLSPDATVSILEELLLAPEHHEVIEDIQKQFQLVFIDEFQDTDAKQWSIFSTLFNRDTFTGSFYLIGDPKQSIYGWRNADLDVFLSSAKASFETHGHLFYLANNYRSTALLLEGLNTLFSQKEVFTTSPNNTPIFYHPLTAQNKDPYPYDLRTPIHFCIYDNEAQLGQWISQEALYLNQTKGIPFGNMAILVADSTQTAKLTPHCSIPMQESGKDIKFKQTKANLFVQNLLEACLYPDQDAYIQTVLTGFLFGLSAPEVAKEETKRQYTRRFSTLHRRLFTHGLLATFYRVVSMRQCTLFSRPVGEAVFQAMEQLCLYLEKISSSPYQQLLFLKQLPEVMNRDTSLYTAPKTDNPEAIKITTIHSSKGLEYDVVFAVGLDKINRNSSKEKDRKDESDNLLYVACTRAKRHLYIPVSKSTARQPSSIWRKYCSSLGFYPEEKDRKTKPIDRLLAFIDTLIQQKPACFSKSFADTPLSTTYTPPSLQPPTYFSLSTIPPSRTICSFSTLKAALDKQTPSEESYVQDTPMFPVGKRVGTIIHKILALISPHFNRSRETILSIVTSFTNNTDLEPHSEYLCDLLLHLFSSPLPFTSAQICLKDLDPGKIFTEADFLLSYQDDLWQGVIDLFFEHKGRFYLIDWKTSFLGNRDEDYSQENMLAHVHSEHLNYQAKIYLRAANQFLEQFELPPTTEMAFVFLRGVYSSSLGFLQWDEDSSSTEDPFLHMKKYFPQENDSPSIEEDL